MMAPSSSTAPSPNRLLITDPKPKPQPGPLPNPASSSSTTTSSPPPQKKTRDQPNLSDCHCCNRRINHTNPKDRLQPLSSVWRIVLLCRNCRRDFHSGQTCPYCFRETVNSGEILTCEICERKIHINCVRDYGDCTPWCYLGAESEGNFRVCVDCWVPDLLRNSIRVCGRKDKIFMENAVKKAKGKVKVGKKMVDLENDGYGKDMDCSKEEDSNCGDAVGVVDDAELAIQLHRAMNSSPRISRSRCLVKGSSVRVWNGLSYARSRLGKNRGGDENRETRGEIAERESDSCINSTGSNPGLLCYKRDKTRKIWQFNEDDIVVPESRSGGPAEIECDLRCDDVKARCSISGNVGMSEMSTRANADRNNVDRLEKELLSYKRSRFKRKLFQENGMDGVCGESSFLDKHVAAFKPDCCQVDDGELKINCHVKSDPQVILPSVSCDADRDHYSLKYGKRAACTKSESSFQRYNSILSGNQASLRALSNSETGFGAERDRYYLKYVKRATVTKSVTSFLHCNALLGENKASTPASNNSAAGYSMKFDGTSNFQNGTSNQGPDRYFLKYSKRVKSSKYGSISETKVHSDAFLKKVEASAAGLTTNCSAESRTLSDVTFNSFTVDLPK